METKDIHKGHRSRIYKTAKQIGLENLSEVQVLEILLTYVHVRKDTNVVAHNLLNKFGSFAGVLDADINDLEKVDGVGERSAKFISFLPQMFFIYTSSKKCEKPKLLVKKDKEDYFKALLQYKPREELYVCGLNAKNEIIKTEKISEGNQNAVEIQMNKIISFINATNPTSVILAHGHPAGEACPSVADISNTTKIQNFLNMINIKLIDHVIIANDEIYSFADNGKLLSKY